MFLLLNKVDLVDDKSMLLPYIEELGRQYSFAEIFQISALKEHNIDALEKVIADIDARKIHFFYPEEQLTDRNARFLSAEFIGKKSRARWVMSCLMK